MQSLADADFIQALESGPAQWRQDWQAKRLSALLQWLSDKPWWKAWTHSRMGPASHAAALSGLPIMGRADYRRLIESHDPIAPLEHGSMSMYSSSGSSGVPVQFWRTALALRINASHYWADHRRQGRNLHERMGIITGYTGHHSGTHRVDQGEPWLHPGVQLARLSTAFSLEEHTLWVCSQPMSYLVTTPATLAGVLSTLNQLNLRPPTIKQILTTSYSVDPELRANARSVFQASIRDRYSCEEFGPIAFQCPESDDHYHCAVANVIVEVVDPSGQLVASGQQGEVLATSLHQWASPAVRYELGDIATWHSQCPGCGCTVPALSQLMGRKYFLLKTRDGSWRHIRLLSKQWLACAPFKEYRLVQKDKESFRAEFVLDHPLTDLESDLLLKMLTQLVGKEFNFELAQMNAIPWPQGRKRQEFVGLMQ